MPLPKWTRTNPGRGRHGVPDKGAHKVGKQWEKEQEKQQQKKRED